MSLFSFIFNTIHPKVNNPGTQRFWLPAVLERTDQPDGRGKLLPLQADSWKIGAITGDAGSLITDSFIDQWQRYLEVHVKVDIENQYAIASPGDPSPRLSLGGAKGKVTIIKGLENLYLGLLPSIRQTPDGYEADFSVEFNYYDGSRGRPKKPVLTLETPYTLEQELCTANDGSNTCNGNHSQNINCNGQVVTQITKAWLRATVKVTVTDSKPQRRLALQIQRLVLSGPGPQPDSLPDLKIQSLTNTDDVGDDYKQMLLSLARQALESSEGQQGIFSNLNLTLNLPGNRSTLSATMTAQMARVLDDLLGQVDGGLPSDSGQSALNPADQYVYDRLRCALNQSSSKWYLPRLLCNVQNPSLEPLYIAQVSLPQFPDFMGIKIWGAKLTELVLHGLTNLQTPAGQIQFAPGSVTFTALLGALTQPPKISCAQGSGIPLPPVTATGGFSMMTDDGPIGGTFTVTASNAQLVCTATADGDDGSNLVVKIQSMKIQMQKLSDLKITVKIDDSAFTNWVNQILNQSKHLSDILDGLNCALAGQIEAIGEQVTKYARQAIDQQLSLNP